MNERVIAPSEGGREGASERDKESERRRERAPFATGSTIVYAPTRKDVEKIAARLQSAGLAAQPYHAGTYTRRAYTHTYIHQGLLRCLNVLPGSVFFSVDVCALGCSVRPVCPPSDVLRRPQLKA